MSLQSAHNKKRSGFSLTEFAIVLGVIGVIISGLWSVVSIVRENMKRTQMKEQMFVAVNGVRDFYLTRACASLNMNCPAPTAASNVILTDHLLRNNGLPYEMLRNRDDATWVADHPWGETAALGSGGMRVYAGNEALTNHDAFFRVEVLGLERDSCVALASKLTGTGTPDGLVSTRINGGSLHDSDADPAAVSPETADGECVAGDANRISLVYTLRAP